MERKINENLTEPCFAALLEVVKEGSDLYFDLENLARKEGSFSIQRRGGKIIESFPWPIGKELSTLFSSSYSQRNQTRLLKIFRVSERIAQFFSYCWLVQLWDAKHKDPELVLSVDFVAQFQNFSKPTIGTYLGIIRSASRILFEAGLPIFFKEDNIRERTEKLVKSIEKLTAVRNKELHFKEEIFCEDAEEILANIMVAAAFIANYPMVSVKGINVDKHKLSDAVYVHKIDQLNSQRSEFSGGTIKLNEFSDSYSVMMVENLQSMGSFLNLSPLVINTEPFLAERGRSKVLHGLYLYSEGRDNHTKYSFVNGSEIHGLSDMPAKDVFAKQWEHLFNCLQP